jgi:hypothetical protein
VSDREQPQKKANFLIDRLRGSSFGQAICLIL